MSVSTQIEIYEYPEDTEEPAGYDWSAITAVVDAEEPEEDDHPPERSEAASVPPSTGISERQLEQEKKLAFEEGREQGVEEGRKAEREAQAAALHAAESKWQQHTAQLTEQFTLERARYFERVEPEVVRLALAIASRILRREAQMDPLMLTGAVRVALGQLSGTAEVRLKVPPAELDMWSDAMSLLPNLAAKPTVVAGDGMRLGDCIVETSMGTVDLGVRSQLGEIESGFFDRAGARPMHSPAHPDPAASGKDLRR